MQYLNSDAMSRLRRRVSIDRDDIFRLQLLWETNVYNDFTVFNISEIKN